MNKILLSQIPEAKLAWFSKVRKLLENKPGLHKKLKQAFTLGSNSILRELKTSSPTLLEHLKKNSIKPRLSIIDFYLLLNTPKNSCEVCNAETPFRRDIFFVKTCSKKCESILRSRSLQKSWKNYTEEDRKIRGKSVSLGIAKRTPEDWKRIKQRQSVAAKRREESLSEEAKQNRKNKCKEASTKMWIDWRETDSEVMRLRNLKISQRKYKTTKEDRESRRKRLVRTLSLKYGVTAANVMQVPEIREKYDRNRRKNECKSKKRLRRGQPNFIDARRSFENQLKKRYKRTVVSFKGRDLNLQGYEPFVFDKIKHKLRYASTSYPVHFVHEGKNRIYYADLYVETLSGKCGLIEVKSSYTYDIWKKTPEKEKAAVKYCKENKINFWIAIAHPKSDTIEWKKLS